LKSFSIRLSLFLRLISLIYLFSELSLNYFSWLWHSYKDSLLVWYFVFKSCKCDSWEVIIAYCFIKVNSWSFDCMSKHWIAYCSLSSRILLFFLRVTNSCSRTPTRFWFLFSELQAYCNCVVSLVISCLDWICSYLRFCLCLNSYCSSAYFIVVISCFQLRSNCYMASECAFSWTCSFCRVNSSFC